MILGSHVGVIAGLATASHMVKHEVVICASREDRRNLSSLQMLPKCEHGVYSLEHGRPSPYCTGCNDPGPLNRPTRNLAHVSFYCPKCGDLIKESVEECDFCRSFVSEFDEFNEVLQPQLENRYTISFEELCQS